MKRETPPGERLAGSQKYGRTKTCAHQWIAATVLAPAPAESELEEIIRRVDEADQIARPCVHVRLQQKGSVFAGWDISPTRNISRIDIDVK